MHALPAKRGRVVRAAAVALAVCLGPGVQAQGEPPDPLRTADAATIAAARAAVARENPQLMQAIKRGGSFSGESFSQAIANQMYSRSDAAAIADARAKLSVEPQGPRSWLLRLPFVNIAVFETDAGLVLIDSGYAPAGPALREALKSLSDKPVHTIVHTHYHADHAWGAWALMDLGPGGAAPRIVTTEAFLDQMGMDLRSHGLVQRNNQQRVMPQRWADVIQPTLTFHRRTTLAIGGEDFVLTHARGETEDQLWAWLPSRRIVVSADYVQDFLPNAGNGKRRQRYVEDWAQALRDMAALRPARVLTMHGPALVDAAAIQDKLGAHAAALQTIADQTLAGLNAGLRVDQVGDAVALPAELAQRPDLRPDYVTAQDIARMVVKQYGGWWDDIPSHWNPAPLAAQARAIAAAAGGASTLIARAKQASRSDPAVAAALADWAWLAAPGDAAVLQGALEVYGTRVDEHTTTQEALVYLEHMTRLKLQLAALARPSPIAK
jgi:glyoxylase-like metal-dependent hydrolase (beta-lactamase superfamily II)